MTLPLSIGILSWGQHNTLKNTLESYAEDGLLYKAAQVFIFFQELSDEDITIADDYNVWYDGSRRNLGIAGGYKAMLDLVTQPNYLFLENDWFHRSTYDIKNKNQIEEGIKYLETKEADVVRYRSQRYPGNPLWSAQFMGKELTRPEYLLEATHWTENLAKAFPDQVEEIDKGWYRTKAKYANWTNNPHMVRTSWAKEMLLPHLGERDIEKDMQEWWEEQEFNVVQGEGLFTHWRIG